MLTSMPMFATNCTIKRFWSHWLFKFSYLVPRKRFKLPQIILFDVTPKVWTVYSSWCIRMSIFAEPQGKDTLLSCLEQRVGGRTAIWPSRPDRRSRSSRSAYIPAAVLTSRMSVVVHTPFYIVWDFFLLDVIWFSSHYSILCSCAILVQSVLHHGSLEDITVQTLVVRRSSPS